MNKSTLKFFSALIAVVIFSALPALLLLIQYNFAVATAYFLLSLVILACYWELSDINEKLKDAPYRS
jgi:hypothetical protein